MRELLAKFVPVADEVYRLQTGEDAECRAFQGFCEDGHYGGRVAPTRTRQGVYAITPGGALLASVNTRSDERMAKMLREALAKWAEIPPERRVLPDQLRQRLAAVRRFEDRYPENGLVLAETVRDLGREVRVDDWRTRAWNEDQVWFTAAEARSMVPADPRVGARHEIPARLVARLARLHLLDTVRGQTPPMPKSALVEHWLTAHVVGVDDQGVQLVFRGRTHTEHERSAGARGVAVDLRGHASWDRAAARFRAFELLAIGERFGASRFNERRDDLDRSRIGFAFRLAPAGHPRVAPAFWSSYRLRD